MKRLSALLVLAVVGLSAAVIPQSDVQPIANRIVSQRFGTDRLTARCVYLGIDEQPSAYAFTYAAGDDAVVTIVMGARNEMVPVNEITHRIPAHQANQDRILDRARNVLGAEPVIGSVYYFGTADEYVAFTHGAREILVNAHDLRVIQKSAVRSIALSAGEQAQLDEKWARYFNASDFRSRAGAIVDSVPFIDWVYGCSPTAASMILYYWDPRGYGKLVDYFYTHWDEPEAEWNDCANVNRELAIAMYTDTLSGSTTIGNIRNGILTVCNTQNGYTFSGSTSPQGGSYNQYNFAWIKTEIDNQRPCHWNVLNYWYAPFGENINHSVTGVGYDITGADTFVIVHNTWDNDEPLWPYWESGCWTYVVTVIPNGSSANNIGLDYPRGGDQYALPLLFKNLKYRVTWHTSGTIDHLKMWYSYGPDAQSYDSLYWYLIGSNIPNTGEYIWTCPAVDCTLRVNVAALSGTNVRLAADGNFGRSYVRELDHSAGIELVGHQDTDGWSSGVVVSGSYAYVADGTNGLVVVDVSDSTLPRIHGHLALPGNSGAIALAGSYVYIGDSQDTLRVVSIADPANPVQVGLIALGDDVLDVLVSGSYAYCAVRSQGLVIVDITTPASPAIEGSFNTAGFAYDLCKSGNYVYVADATKGVRAIDVSDPSAPVETGYNDTNGIGYGVACFGSYVYLADGTQGIKVLDASSPDTLMLLGALDTPGTSSDLVYRNGHVFVADGTGGGIRVINVSTPSSPSEVGYIDAYGVSADMVLAGDLIYFADGSTGLLIISQSLVGIQEWTNAAPHLSIRSMPTVVTGDFCLRVSTMSAMTLDVDLYDICGRFVQHLYSGVIGAGVHTLNLKPASGVPAGVYFLKIRGTDTQELRKLVIVR